MKNEKQNVSQKSNATLPIPASLLDETLAAIARYEEIIEEEWGHRRSSRQLIKDGEMPAIYHKLLAIKMKSRQP